MGFRFSFPIPVSIKDYTEPGPYLAISEPCLFVQAEAQDEFAIENATGKPLPEHHHLAIFKMLRKSLSLDRAYKFKLSCSLPELLANEGDLFPMAVIMSAYHIQHKRFNRPMREEVLNLLFSEGLITNKAFCLTSSIGGILFSSPDLPYVQLRLPKGIHACLDTGAVPFPTQGATTHRLLLLQKACLLTIPNLLQDALSADPRIMNSRHPAYLGTLPTSSGHLHFFENKAALDRVLEAEGMHQAHQVALNLNGFEKS
ncbi:MAG TPA: hypothetical protein VJ917_02515 [Saprospiraceae bacterium]|nr:hypothetical protein [Saprospiraceae bacterium]